MIREKLRNWLLGPLPEAIYPDKVYGFLFDVKPKETILKNIIAKMVCDESRIKHLTDQIKELKSGVWKDTEFARMAKRYEEMQKEYNSGFPITDAEWKKIREWQDAKKLDPGVSGGNYVFHFQPTGLGTAAWVTSSDGDKLVFQELG